MGKVQQNKEEDLGNHQLRPCALVQFAREPTQLRDLLDITIKALMLCFMTNWSRRWAAG